jgi:hypothetical protein
MAKTPEAIVKQRIKDLLSAHGAYRVMPVSNGMGAHGIPDFLVCHCGRFIGVEAKAGKGQPTELQLSNLRQIEAAGGVALIINETNLDELNGVLHVIKIGGTPQSNYRLFERAQETDGPDGGPTLKKRGA